MAFGNLLCLAIGAAWLAVGIGLEQAIEFGVVPFFIGAFLKSALGAAVLRMMNGPARPAE